MSKRFLTYEEQYQNLILNKNIEMDLSKQQVIEYLEKNSYYDFINSTKLILYKKKTDVHEYEKLPFSLWKKEYENMLLITNHVIGEIMSIERHLCSILSYHVASSFNDNNSDFSFIDTFVNFVKDNKYINLPKTIQNNSKEMFEYITLNSWKYMHYLTFGNLVNILNKCNSSFKESCMKKLDVTTYELKTLLKVRNDLFHHTPLCVTLNKGESANDRRRRRKSVEAIMKNSSMYVEYVELTRKITNKSA